MVHLNNVFCCEAGEEMGPSCVATAEQDGIDEGTQTSFPSPPQSRCGPFLSRFAGEDEGVKPDHGERE